MKKPLILLSLLLNTIICLGQNFAIVNDKDGFVNMRDQPSLEAKIVTKIHVDEIFWIEDLKQNWYKIYFNKGDESGINGKQGYLHKSRVKLLTTLTKLGVKSVKSNQYIIGNDSITISVNSSKFDINTHKAGYSDKALVRIDNKRFWGTDGNIPKRYIQSLNIKVNQTIITIPESAFNDLYEPTLNSLNCYTNNGKMYVMMENSDGAGGYTVFWVIKNNRYFGRSIQTY